MENCIYQKAKTKEEYLENAAKIIIYLRDTDFKVVTEENLARLRLMEERARRKRRPRKQPRPTKMIRWNWVGRAKGGKYQQKKNLF